MQTTVELQIRIYILFFACIHSILKKIYTTEINLEKKMDANEYLICEQLRVQPEAFVNNILSMCILCAKYT